MKIIDLLNKVANGEEVPEIIKYNDFIYKYDKDICDYDGDGLYLFDNTDRLNNEVEILEEKKIPKKLPDIRFENGKFYLPINDKQMYILREVDKVFLDKINEIIDYLKSKGDE